jgi:hypothetical protein
MRGDELARTFLTPTLIHLGVVFLISLLALSPEGGGLILPSGLIGVVCLLYSLTIALKAARASFCSCFPIGFSCISMLLRMLASPNPLPSPFASMDLTEETAGPPLWPGDFRRVRGMAVSRRWLA